MALVTTPPREVEKGTFVGFRKAEADRPTAHIFVPNDPAEAGQFSFFWRGQAQRFQVHELLNGLFVPQSDIKARLIERFFVSNYELSPISHPDAPPTSRHLDFTHRLIEAADLPASLGLALDTHMPDDEVHPSSVYVWMSIDTEERIGRVQGNPELGVRINLRDWHKPVFEKAVFPLLESTAELERGEVPDLWSQAPRAAEELMRRRG